VLLLWMCNGCCLRGFQQSKARRASQRLNNTCSASGQWHLRATDVQHHEAPKTCVCPPGVRPKLGGLSSSDPTRFPPVHSRPCLTASWGDRVRLRPAREALCSRCCRGRLARLVRSLKRGEAKAYLHQGYLPGCPPRETVSCCGPCPEGLAAHWTLAPPSSQPWPSPAHP
jgi:hypothetical protein